jgi:hypothetical protein
MGLMRRRYGYYWAKLIGAVLILAAWVVGFICIMLMKLRRVSQRRLRPQAGCHIQPLHATR